MAKKKQSTKPTDSVAGERKRLLAERRRLVRELAEVDLKLDLLDGKVETPSEDEIQEASRYWRKYAPDEAKDLIDAESED